jgi:predicted GNAT family acetyltransferase
VTSNDQHAEPSSSFSEDPKEDKFRVIDNAEAHRYEAYLGSELAGFLDYHAQPGLLTILHTEVDRSYEGRGVGSRLAAHVLDDIRQRGMEVLPICPFVIAYIKQNPEYTDLLRFQ